MMIDTYYKEDGKEYAKQYGTEVEVNHEDKIATIDGVNYTLRHAKAPRIEDDAPLDAEISKPEKKSAKRKK
jgi:hypothetical protein